MNNFGQNFTRVFGRFSRDNIQSLRSLNKVKRFVSFFILVTNSIISTDISFNVRRKGANLDFVCGVFVEIGGSFDAQFVFQVSSYGFFLRYPKRHNFSLREELIFIKSSARKFINGKKTAIRENFCT